MFNMLFGSARHYYRGNFRRVEPRDVPVPVLVNGERVSLPVEVVATVPRKYGDEPVARFTLGLSLKRT